MEFYLDGIFSDGCVLQRDRDLKIRGFCPKGAKPTAEFDGEDCVVTTEQDGCFCIRLAPQSPSTGHTLTVKNSNDEIKINDICFGDVFLLSGQSNMELEVERCMDVSADVILAADYPLIRQFTVLPRYRFGAYEFTTAPNKWTKAVYPDVRGLSAAGFFFAVNLYKEINVPIGLVQTAVGGASVEAWTPEETLNSLGICTDEIKAFYDMSVFNERLRSEEEAHERWHELLKSEDEEKNARVIPEGAKEYTVPGISFDTFLDGFSGSVWFYKEIEVKRDNETEGLLYLGELIDSDRTYINGRLIGETTYRYPPRKYKIPVGTLKKGKNLIASRLVFLDGVGGFILDHPYYIEADSVRTELSGQWLAWTESKAAPAPEVLFPPHLPTGLYNGSVYPLRDTQFTALLWYQGETNTNAPKGYNEKFDAMVEAWRQLFNQELPVVCVELCDFIEPAQRFFDTSGWEDIKRQQRRQPQITKRCAVALAGDLGESYEIHPGRKAELGERLAREILRLVYGVGGEEHE